MSFIEHDVCHISHKFKLVQLDRLDQLENRSFVILILGSSSLFV